MRCYYCQKEGDLRPYGPNMSMVCFRCAMSTQDRKDQTSLNFGLQLEGCGPVAVLDGSEKGPYPYLSYGNKH